MTSKMEWNIVSYLIVGTKGIFIDNAGKILIWNPEKAQTIVLPTKEHDK